MTEETLFTYLPQGTGLCIHCGQDVGAHDGGHEHIYHSRFYPGICRECGEGWDHPIHDVGRVLRCPEVKA